ncbi:hypothetical protein RAA17_18255 [Komagataeibacter rhaeticus]|nr:hypothetical protein [Komagataeibacter rhaeticus]
MWGRRDAARRAPALAAGVALLAALAARPAPAAPSAQPAPAPARGDWPTSRQAATGNADDDPVAAKLLVYLRLLSPRAAARMNTPPS